MLIPWRVVVIALSYLKFTPWGIARKKSGILRLVGRRVHDWTAAGNRVFWRRFMTRRIHGTGIFTYIYYEIQLNSGKDAILGSYGLLVIKVRWATTSYKS